MVDNMVVIRKFNEERDKEIVGKLERDCEMKGSSNVGGGGDGAAAAADDDDHHHKGVSIFTKMMGNGDPLCRIRLYTLHLMLVAELRESGELVGVVRGCIKHVGTKLGGTNVKLGCILGLRVSPKHRRAGIGVRLVSAVEEWMALNGVDYTFIATEKDNVASTNLFTNKCNYTHLGSLVIFVQDLSARNTNITKCVIPQSIKIEKLSVDEAISLYNLKLKEKDMYPADIDSILNEKLSLGTWVSFFKDEKWICIGESTPSSWVMFSIWSSCETKKPKIQMKFLHSALGNARDKILRSCLKVPDVVENKRFGFLFLYGIHGEGERVGELMKSTWGFAVRMAETMKGCEAIMTETGVSDPLKEYLRRQEIPGLSCIDDVWYIKKAGSNGEGDEEVEEVRVPGEVGNVFVDPRDF